MCFALVQVSSDSYVFGPELQRCFEMIGVHLLSTEFDFVKIRLGSPLRRHNCVLSSIRDRVVVLPTKLDVSGDREIGLRAIGYFFGFEEKPWHECRSASSLVSDDSKTGWYQDLHKEGEKKTDFQIPKLTGVLK